MFLSPSPTRCLTVLLLFVQLFLLSSSLCSACTISFDGVGTDSDTSSILPSQSTTIVFSSFPFASSDILSALTFTTVSKTPFYAQLYSDTLVLKRSLAVTPSVIGTFTVNLNWGVSRGWMVALSYSNVLSVSNRAVEPVDAASTRFVNIIKGANTIVNGASTLEKGNEYVENRLFAMTVSTINSCDALTNAGVCPLSGFPLSVPSNQSSYDAPSFINLLAGQPILADDYLESVRYFANTTANITIHIWTPTTLNGAVTYMLKYSQLFSPPNRGYHRVLIGQNVLENDVIGFSFDSYGSVGFVDDPYEYESSRVAQFTNPLTRGQIPNTLNNAQQPTNYYRKYDLQVFLAIQCNLMLKGPSSLYSQRISEQSVGESVLFTGQFALVDQYLYRVSVLITALRPLVIQLYSVPRYGTYILKYSQTYTPDSVGVTSISLGWPMQVNDVLGITSAPSAAIPIGFIADDKQSAQNNVDVFNEINIKEQQKLSSTPQSYTRIYNVQIHSRVYGVCTGAATIPQYGSIGTCAYLSSTTSSQSTCSYTCPPNYNLLGSPALLCSSTSIGVLEGAQTCQPKNCTLNILPSTFATLGTCNSTINSGTTCSLQCLPGYISLNSTSLSCFASVVSTTFTKCIIPAKCTFPASVPVGALLGNCTLNTIMEHGEACILDTMNGYKSFNGTDRMLCFNGKLSPFATFIPSPCIFPDLTSNLQYGNCSSVLSSTSNPCHVQCDRGYKLIGPSTYKCINGTLSPSSTLPVCRIYPNCTLPLAFPEGAGAGDCTEGESLSIFGGVCHLTLLDGYRLVSGVLRYHCSITGKLSAGPTIIPTPCTLPTPPLHADYGTCSNQTDGMDSGSSCQVTCKEGYQSTDSMNFVCNYGELIGTYPTCKRVLCTLPTHLPYGLSSGSCILGGLLRSEGNDFPSSCTLGLLEGYSLSEGSLTVTCATDGTLSNFPVPVHGIVPLHINGTCFPADPTARSFMGLTNAGVLHCPDNLVLHEFFLESCSPGGGITSGLMVHITCVYNSLLDMDAATVDIGSSLCSLIANFPPLVLDGSELGVLACPPRSALVSFGYGSCYDMLSRPGVQIQGRCRPIKDEIYESSKVGFWANQKSVTFMGACSSTAPIPSSNLFAFTQTNAIGCPLSIYNFMSVLRFDPCWFQNQIEIVCTVYHPTLPGYAGTPVNWYGPTVQQQSYIDESFSPQCNIMSYTSILSEGVVFAFRFWAKSKGPLTLQTYRVTPKHEYVVTGSFRVEVTTTGYQQIGIPPAQQWNVSQADYLGFCVNSVPIIGGGLYSNNLPNGPPHEDLNLFAPVVVFSGQPVAVGAKAGGGDDSGLQAKISLIYSLQIGVRPFLIGSMGWNITDRLLVESTRLPTCQVLDAPRIMEYGYVTGFKVFIKKNKGQLILQTYRRVGPQDLLQGSYTVPLLIKGDMNITIPDAQRWLVHPEDKLAFCYTHNSLPFNIDFFRITDVKPVLGVDQLNPNFVNWRNFNPGSDRSVSNRPRWIQYIGDIQQGVGNPLLGLSLYDSVMLRSYLLNNAANVWMSLHQRQWVDWYNLEEYPNYWLAYYDRMFSIQVVIDHTLACIPESPVALYGHGSVSCVGLQCVLTCDEGYGAAVARQTCQTSGLWTDQGHCRSIGKPTLTQSWALSNLDQYQALLRWTQPNLNDGVVVLGWQLSWGIQFPNSTDLSLDVMSGVASNVTTLIFPADSTSYVLPTDTGRTVEHVGIVATITAIVTGGSSTSQATVITTPCACDFYRARHEFDDWKSAITHGYPLDLAVTQQLGVPNSISIEMTPNSLCAKSYRVTLTATDGTALPVSQLDISTYFADNSNSCSFFTKIRKVISAVQYPNYGRELNVCVFPNPMFICSKCQTSYNDGSEPASILPQCVKFRAAFSLNIAGEVMTLPTAASSISNGVSGVTITATIVDPDTSEPIQIVDDNGVLTPITHVGLTDNRGKFKFILSSEFLPLKKYGIRITPSRSDYNAATGITTVHQFVFKGDTDFNYFLDRFTHGSYATTANFYDLSVVPLLGSITLPNVDSYFVYQSDAFRGCGVKNITISVYSVNDIYFQNPLSQSDPTLTDGSFILTVPIYSDIVLVPSQKDVNRTFDPPSLIVNVKQSLLQISPIFDTTMNTMKLMIDGGNCAVNIGRVAPTIFLTSCGASAHVLLPAFADGLGYTYQLPALTYTVKLYDPKNPFSGLQGTNTDSTVLPDWYLNGDVFSFLSSNAPFTTDLSDPSIPLDFHFTYRATPDISLPTPPCSDPKAPSGSRDYFYFFQAGKLTFTLSETYGYVTADGIDRTSICTNVTADIDILDGVSNGKLVIDYTVAPNTCSDGNHPCKLAAEFNPKDRSTKLTYYFITGNIQRSEFATDSTNTAHTQPAFSRIIQYRLSGSAFPWQKVYVVTVGDSPIDGALSIQYPPWDALYILRDPPGGSSTASITMSNSITTSTTLAFSEGEDITASLDTHVGAKNAIKFCAGPEIGVEFVATVKAGQRACMKLLDLFIDGSIAVASGVGSTDALTNASIITTAFETTVTTSADPNVIDGDGDMYLTLDGTFSLRMAYSVKVEIDPSTQQCHASSVPKVTWSEDPDLNYMWVNNWNIKYVLLTDLRLANRMILEEAGVVCEDHNSQSCWDNLKAADQSDKNSKYHAFRGNLVAIRGWESLMQHNEDLKKKSVEWTDFYKHINNKNSTSIKPNPTDPSSITFYGDFSGEAGLSFEITASSTQAMTRTVEATYQAGFEGGVDVETVIQSIMFATKASAITSFEITHGTERSFETMAGNTLSIALGDPDEGDQFQIQMYKDTVYGSPVYKLVGGVSRCPSELGTVAREKIEIIFEPSFYSHVNPEANLGAYLTLINQSPTQEDFLYTIIVNMETNKNGLQLFLGSLFDVKYNVNERVVVSTFIGDGYIFDGVQIQMYSIPKNEHIGRCVRANATLSIHYDEPCGKIDFAGPIAVSKTFNVNYNSILSSASHSAVLSVTVHNPDFSNNPWLDSYAKGYLEEVSVDYRPAPPGRQLSETDWQPIKRKGAGNDPPPLLTVLEQDAASERPQFPNEFMTLIWDVSSLADGFYQLRAKTSCKVPAGAEDESLYYSFTDIITGRIDMIPPKLFGDPLPALASYYPGGEISASFDKKVNCDSYFGKTKAVVWINPGSVSVPQGTNTVVPTLVVCKDNKVEVALYAPAYESLVGRLLTVKLTNVYDHAGNLVFGETITWSFNVGFFDSKLSAALVTGLQLNFPFSFTTLQSLYGSAYSTVKALQAGITAELTTFVNSAIDTFLRPPTNQLASSTLYGLRAGSLVISPLSNTTDLFKTQFNVTILPLPTFPGDPVSIYSPSFFANYLVKAINNQSSIKLNNASFYPLFSRLSYSSSNPKQVNVIVYPVSSGPPTSTNSTNSTKLASFRSHAHLMGAVVNTPQYFVLALNVGLNPGSTVDSSTASVYLSWMVNTTAASPLDLTNIDIFYTDTTFINNPKQTLHSKDTAAESLITLSNNVQSLKAVYALSLFSFPSVVGGFTASIEIPIYINNSLAYTIFESSFIVGPPSTPVISSIVQTSSVQLIALSFFSTAYSGLTKAVGDSLISYSITLNVGTAVATVPARFLNFTRATILSGSDLVTCTFNMSSVLMNYGYSVPTGGAVLPVTLGVFATSSIATSSINQQNFTYRSLPSPIHVYRTAQTAMNSWIIRFYGTTADDADSYQLTYKVSAGNFNSSNTLILSVNSLQLISFNPPQLPLYSYSLTIPYVVDASPWNSISIGLAVNTSLGLTQPVFHSIYNPVYVTPPTQLDIVLITSPTKNNRSAVLDLFWQSPSIISPNSEPSLLKGFDIFYTYSDGSAIVSPEAFLSSIPSDMTTTASHYRTRVLVPYFLSPQNKPTIYAIHIRCSVFSSNHPAVIYRTDGTGLYVFNSNSTSQTVTIGPLAGINNTNVNNQSTSFNSNSIQILGAGIVPATIYPFERVATCSLSPPYGLSVSQLPTGLVRLLFPVVSGADSYSLMWFEMATSAQPIGTKSISKQQVIDDIVVVAIPNPTQGRSYTAMNTSVEFKFIVAAVNNTCHSQYVVQYLSIAPLLPLDYSLTVSPASALVRSMLVGGLPGWNITLIDQPQTPINVRFDGFASQPLSIRTVFLHQIVKNIEPYFNACPANVPVSLIQQFSTFYSCNNASTSFLPQLNKPNILYVQFITNTLQTQFAAINVFIKTNH